MFRQTWTAALVAVTALGSLTPATAQESKAAGGKKQITNSIGMKLTLIPAGEFKMDSGERRAGFVLPHFGNQLRQVGLELVAHRVELVDLAPADQPRRHAGQIVRREDHHRLGGQLLDAVKPHRFGLVGHAVGLVNDGHLPARAGHRRQAQTP